MIFQLPTLALRLTTTPINNLNLTNQDINTLKTNTSLYLQDASKANSGDGKMDNLTQKEATDMVNQAPTVLAMYKNVNVEGGWDVGTKDEVAKYVNENMPSLTEKEKQQITNEILDKMGTNTLSFIEVAGLVFGVTELGEARILNKVSSQIKNDKNYANYLEQESKLLDNSKIETNSELLNKVSGNKTPEELINTLKQKPITTETIEVPNPVAGQLNKESQIKLFTKENKLSSQGTKADKVEKVENNMTKKIIETLGEFE